MATEKQKKWNSTMTFSGQAKGGKSPCKNCDNRHEGCHIDCVLYYEYSQIVKDIKEKAYTEKKKSEVLVNSAKYRVRNRRKEQNRFPHEP